MRSFVCSGTAIIVCTFCSTMLMRPLNASSSCASRTRIDDFSLQHAIAHGAADPESFAFVGARDERVAFENQQHAALRIHRLDREIEHERDRVRSASGSPRTPAPRRISA